MKRTDWKLWWNKLAKATQLLSKYYFCYYSGTEPSRRAPLKWGHLSSNSFLHRANPWNRTPYRINMDTSFVPLVYWLARRVPLYTYFKSVNECKICIAAVWTWSYARYPVKAGIHPGFFRGPPPRGYVCNRCRKPGHWIQLCPTNGVSNIQPLSVYASLSRVFLFNKDPAYDKRNKQELLQKTRSA